MGKSYFSKASLSLCLHRRVRTKRETSPDGRTKASSPSLSRERPREVRKTCPFSCTLYSEWGILKGERSGKIFKNRAVWSFVDLHVFEDLVPLHLKRRFSPLFSPWEKGASRPRARSFVPFLPKARKEHQTNTPRNCNLSSKQRQ